MRAIQALTLISLLTLVPTVSAEVLASGVTEAIHDTNVSVTAPGRVEAITVKEGQRVRKGDLLLYLDRDLEALEVKRRELMLADDARLRDLQEREGVLAQQVSHARALMASGGVTRKQVEDENLAWRAVVAERQALEFAKQREQVELDLARESYQRRHVRAPFSGVIIKILVRSGQSIEANAPAIRLMDTTRVRFVGTFSATSGFEPIVGSKVRLRLGYGKQTQAQMREATITFVSPAIDTASGLIELTAEMDNRVNPVRPGVIGQLLLQSK